MTDRQAIVDSVGVEFHLDGGIDGAEVVELDDTPYADAFGTDEFYEIPTTFSRPIVYEYTDDDGTTRHLKKPIDELRDAAWTANNAPVTLEHPLGNVVRHPSQVHGFVDDVSYDSGIDGLAGYTYIPTNDEEAIEYADRHGGVSMGFHARTDTDVDDERVTVDGQSVELDGYQREIHVDHIAITRDGRCSVDEGCGMAHADAVAGTETESSTTADADMSVGDWAEWDASGGTTYGKVDEIIREGCTTRGKGSMKVCAEENDPVAVLEVYDDETGESKDEYVRHKMSELRSWSGPNGDSACDETCSVGPCSCGLHDPLADAEVNGETIDLVPPEAAQNAAQAALDARADEDVTVNGMTDHGWSRAEQLASGEELSPSDIVGGTGAMAPWWSRHESHTVEEGSLAGSDKKNPWSDNSYTAGKGWGGVTGMKWAYRKGNQIKKARGKEQVYGDAEVRIPDFEDGDLVRHRYIEDLRGRVAHNPRDKPYVMVDPLVDGSVNNHTMTFGTADIELVSKASDMSNKMADATTVMDTITFDDTKGGDLDESRIPNDEFEAHYVFDGDTKSDSSFPLVDADGNLRRENVIAAASYSGDAEDEAFLMDVLRQVNDEFDDPPLDEATLQTDANTDSDTNNDSDTMTDDTEDDQSDSKTFIDASNMSIDALAAVNDAVDEVVDERDELSDELDEVRAELDSVRDELDEVRSENTRLNREPLADEIMSLTDAYEREDLMETPTEELEARLDGLTSVAPEDDESDSEATPTGVQTSTDSETDEDDDGLSVSMDHRSWA